MFKVQRMMTRREFAKVGAAAFALSARTKAATWLDANRQSPGRIELPAAALDELVEALRLQQLVQPLIKRMPRRRRQLPVRDPQILLLLPLPARPHRHAPILQTYPVNPRKTLRLRISTCTTGC